MVIRTDENVENTFYMVPFSHDIIEQQVATIDRMVKRHRIMALSINGVLIVSQALQVMHILKICFFTPVVPAVNEGYAHVLSEKEVPVMHTEKMKNFFSRIKMGLFSMPGSIKEIIVSGSLFKALLYTTRELGVYFATQIVVDLFLSTVHHNDDLHWFIRHHAPYRHTIDLGQEYVMQLLMHNQESANKAFYHKALGDICTQLVLEIQEMLAFMEHKIKRLVPSAKPQAQRVVDFIFNNTHQWINDMRSVWTAPVVDYLQVQALLTRFKNDLDREGKHFAKLEKKILKPRLLEYNL